MPRVCVFDVNEALLDLSALESDGELRVARVLRASALGELCAAPAAEPYRMAAHSLKEELANIRLIAAHAWDVAGTLRAGCTAAFVDRLGKVLDSLFESPDVVGRDLREVAQKLLEAEKEG